MAMARGHSSLGQLLPCLITHGIQPPKFSFLSLTHFSSHNHTNYHSLPLEQNPPNPLQQETPFPHMPCEQAPWQLTPGLSGTRWSEDLFHSNQTLPGLSPSSQPHEDISACEPEPEVDPTQSLEEPLG
ncbi:hypothetical protein O181_029802 [Austropuccinia psidii MF-1]|uniref:Uncharacterized protein n=1 Tax=Austropuccinia psidii MF-1 TaxID=1389203 RepID=A0A9Q3CUI1_9BASI|nr:hypothetical protein [Austropuccinia psidii MF-1]